MVIIVLYHFAEIEKGTTRREKISLLGATGSIGWQTYDILKEQRDAFHLVAFSSGKTSEKRVK